MLCLDFTSRVHPGRADRLPPEESMERVAGGAVDELARREHQLRILRNAPVMPDTECELARCLLAGLSNSGRLLRATVAYESAMAQNLSMEHAESISCAVEYFHIASLMLDDLPSMDDATKRRGRVCLHLRFGEGTVILSALALITRAYGLLGKAIAGVAPERQGGAHAYVERCLGVTGIIGGQASDLSFQRCKSVARTKRIALRKTAMLIELALVLPALLAGTRAIRRRNLRRLGICWGLLYQGLDDVSDVIENPESSGKTTGRDAALERPNLILQAGRTETARYLDRLACIARMCVANLIAEGGEFAFLRAHHEVLESRAAAFTNS